MQEEQGQCSGVDAGAVKGRNFVGTKIAKENDSYVRGFKIRLGYIQVYADNPIFDPIYEYAESKNLPELFHTGDTAFPNGSLVHAHPLTLERLLQQARKPHIVRPHFGNPWMTDVGESIYKHANVYADIPASCWAEAANIRETCVPCINRGYDAIYFAGGVKRSSSEHASTFLGLHLVEQLKIEKDDMEKILFRNALELFSLAINAETQIREVTEKKVLIPLTQTSKAGIRDTPRFREIESCFRGSSRGPRGFGSRDAEKTSARTTILLVYYVAVLPEYRGKKIGGMLLDRSLSYFFEQGVNVVFASLVQEHDEPTNFFRITVSRGTFWRGEQKISNVHALNMYRKMVAVSGEVVVVKELSPKLAEA